ncbi:hypothetical protein [Streptomyces pseudovenezuelae]|uniref:hypothetical protein n=1 Tax=Streptomyces pseudovenezuelae TaxID=67350 RepID=UPI0036E107F9
MQPVLQDPYRSLRAHSPAATAIADLLDELHPGYLSTRHDRPAVRHFAHRGPDTRERRVTCAWRPR